MKFLELEKIHRKIADIEVISFVGEKKLKFTSTNLSFEKKSLLKCTLTHFLFKLFNRNFFLEKYLNFVDFKNLKKMYVREELRLVLHAEIKEPEINAMQHGRDAKSQWCGFSAEDCSVWWARDLFLGMRNRMSEEKQQLLRSRTAAYT